MKRSSALSRRGKSPRTDNTRAARGVVAAALGVAGAVGLGGCPVGETPNNSRYINSTDSTNGGARFVGSNACKQCHADVAALHSLTPHANALQAIRGSAPPFPTGAAGVPTPPSGFAWTDISYVVGGFSKGAFFLDKDGYVLTTGVTGVNTQWQSNFGPNGSIATFTSFAPGDSTPRVFDFDSFARRTVGPAQLDPADPQFQDNRQGIQGNWHETGAQCESCHGPGGGHFSTVGADVRIDRSRIFVDPSGSDSCARCHSRPYDSGDTSREILAADGYIRDQQQWTELKSSGGHANFACTICHDPHRSVSTDRAAAIRNECSACHATQSMAGHGGKTFRRGDYAEPVTCVSCHMPFAARAISSAAADVVAPGGKMGDTRTHIFRIETTQAVVPQLFTDDGLRVRRDARGRAAVTVDFVCLRCHNDQGPFTLTPARAAEIAGRVHQLP